MPKSKIKPFAALCFYFRKPKPWKCGVLKLQQNIHQKDGVTLKKIVTYLKCSNASSMLMGSYEKKHTLCKWSKKRQFPFLKRNMEICVNAWSAYEERFRNWIGEHIEPSQKQIEPSQNQVTNYYAAQHNNDDEDDDSFLAAIDRIPLSPSPSPSNACNKAYRQPSKPVSSLIHPSERIFEAVFRGESIPSKRPHASMLKKRSLHHIYKDTASDDSEVVIDYLVEEPPESVTSSTDCRERIMPARGSLISKKLSVDEYAHETSRAPLSSVTEMFANNSSATIMKTPTIRSRTVQQMARSVKRCDLVNYSDSDHDDDSSENENDYENDMTPIQAGRCRGRRIIHSPTTEERKRTVKKRKYSPPPLSHTMPRRSPRIKSSNRQKAQEKAKPTTRELLITRPLTQQRRSARLETSYLSDVQEPKKRQMLAIEAPPSLKVTRKVRWNKIEIDRLKVALRASGCPRSLQDWTKIANSIGDRSAEECREQAEKRRLWKPEIDLGSGNETSCKPNKLKDDYFADKTYGDMSLFDNLDPDDTLLSILKTPTEPAKFSRMPQPLQQVLNETRYSSRSSFNDSI